MQTENDECMLPPVVCTTTEQILIIVQDNCRITEEEVVRVMETNIHFKVIIFFN